MSTVVVSFRPVETRILVFNTSDFLLVLYTYHNDIIVCVQLQEGEEWKNDAVFKWGLCGGIYN